jgi:hypothetical protein
VSLRSRKPNGGVCETGAIGKLVLPVERFIDHSELHAAFLNVHDILCGVALREDRFFSAKLSNRSAQASRVEKQFHIKSRAVVCGQSEIALWARCWQAIQDCLLRSSKGFLASTAPSLRPRRSFCTKESLDCP